MTLEKTLERRVTTWCERHSLCCLKLSGPMGWPDRTIIGERGICFLEFKQPGSRNRPSPMQVKWRELLSQKGFRCEVVYSFEEAVQVIQEVMG